MAWWTVMAALAADLDGDGADSSVDCDDTNPYVSPDLMEECEPRDPQIDNDCDGSPHTSNGVPIGGKEFWADADGDGFGDPTVSTELCGAPDGWVANAADCDDTDPAVYPGADELCDGFDNDCDGQVDNDDWPDADPNCLVVFADADQDGWGDVDAERCLCPADEIVHDGVTYLEHTGDCDDADPLIHPDAPERLTGRDDDCDGRVALAEADCDDDTYRALDPADDCAGDGVGVCWGASVDLQCDAATAWHMVELDGRLDVVAAEGDCNDADASVFPGAVEVEDDGVDQDCDGSDVVTVVDTGSGGEPLEGQSCGGCSTGTGPGLLLIGLAGVFARRRRRRS